MNLSIVPPLETCTQHKRLVCPLKAGQPDTEALSYYMGMGSQDINGLLRGARSVPTWGYSLAEVNDYIDQIDRLILRVPRSKAPLRVYRGMNQEPWGFKQRARADYYLDQSLQDPGFMSASSRRHIAKGFASRHTQGILLEIVIPAGTPLLWTHLIPNKVISQDESEILLPRNSKLTITRCLSSTAKMFGGGSPLEVEAALLAPSQSEMVIPLRTRMRWRWRKN